MKPIKISAAPVITCDLFLEKSGAIINTQGESELWDDFQAAVAFYKENPHLHVFTITETDGVQILTEGAHFVNRLYYLFCQNRVILPDGFLVWWPEE